MSSLVLWPFLKPVEILAFAAGNIFIDIDHYIYYVQRCKRLDPRGMFAYHEELFSKRRDIPYAGICIFHTVDFFVLVGAIAVFNRMFLFLLAGLLVHFVTDLVTLWRGRYLSGRAFFVIEHIQRARAHKKRGYPYYSPCGSRPERGGMAE